MDKIKGIIVPLVTPLAAQDTIDVAGTEKLVDHVLGGGVAALFILGTTGESQSLSVKTRRDFIELVCRTVDGRAPVLVGVTETSMSEAIALAQYAEACGASGVVAAAPYYYASSQADLISWFRTLADCSPLPVYLYNMPSHVKVFLELQTVIELSVHPNIAGLKDSSANMTYFAALLHHFAGTGFALYMGPEEQMPAAVALGADGGVNGGANMFPELYVEAYVAAARGDLEAVMGLQKKIMGVSGAIYNAGDGNSSYLCGLKCALEVMGICDGYVALPYKRFDEDRKNKISELLKQLDV
ncbi:MAG: dihydrodipicolinate synthase family protein [Bacteroidales bacterium]|nr:dihydrodipicolinate synthase family protein [Bacteroidales bacterium]